MKLLRVVLLVIAGISLFCTSTFCLPESGFCLPDSVREMTLRYKSVKHLIVLPVLINNSITVNLILDTGCRNLVLFGRKFEKMLTVRPENKVKFSGLGNGRPIAGSLSINNRVSIDQVLGEKIPIVVVPQRNLFSEYPNIDGVIGFDIFFKFEIEINSREELITFRPAEYSLPPQNFAVVPLRIVETRPVMDSQVLMRFENNISYDMMIDTGSSFGLLVKTSDMRQFRNRSNPETIGFGFNGAVRGYQTIADQLFLQGFRFTDVPTGVIECEGRSYASMGMSVLKDYVVVINYFKMYACFKKWRA